jgi:indole-3-pyruvate monooxygenase
MPPPPTNTLLIGASIAGLATATSLRKQGIPYSMIEKQSQVAAPWRNHYDRLHLHTNKRHSTLPYKKFGKTIPRYPSRQQVVDYLDDYQKAFDIQPIFNTEVLAIKKADGHWIAQTTNGLFSSTYLIMATGAFSQPRPVGLPGSSTFPGRILHSAQYKTGPQ